MAERKEYTVTLFKDKNKWGFSLSPVKRLSTAERQFNEALKSGKYESVVLREKTIYSYYNSVSSPIAIFTKG